MAQNQSTEPNQSMLPTQMPQNQQQPQEPRMIQEIQQIEQQLLQQNQNIQNQILPREEQSGQSESDQPDQKQGDDPELNLDNSKQISSRADNFRNYNSNLFGNDKIPSCHCKKSKCLKMYCDCYAKGNKCRETCRCIGCQNTKNAFREKKPDCRNDEEISRSQDSNKKSIKMKERACNCKKSFCLKKYCECFNANIPCTEICKCEDCKNNGQNNPSKDDKFQGSNSIVENTFFNLTLKNQLIDLSGQINGSADKKEELIRKRQKPDEDEIETKISQILKLVPQQNYQTMLDFLAYCLS